MTTEEFENYAKCCWIRLNVLKAKRMTQEEKELSAMAYLKYADELESLVLYHHSDTDHCITVSNPPKKSGVYVFYKRDSDSQTNNYCVGFINASGGVAIYADAYSRFNRPVIKNVCKVTERHWDYGVLNLKTNTPVIPFVYKKRGDIYFLDCWKKFNIGKVKNGKKSVYSDYVIVCKEETYQRFFDTNGVELEKKTGSFYPFMVKEVKNDQ